MTTITIDRALLEQALEAMQIAAAELDSPYTSETPEERVLRAAMDALRAALAQEQDYWAQEKLRIMEQEHRNSLLRMQQEQAEPVQEPVNDIIRMAREAGFETKRDTVWVDSWEITRSIERLVALVRADEREACARACKEYTDNGGGNVEDHEGHGHHLAAILRARSKA